MMKIMEMGQRIMGRVEVVLNLRKLKANAVKGQAAAEAMKAATAEKAQRDAELLEVSEEALADIADLNAELAAIKAEYDALEAKLKATKAEYLADMKHLKEGDMLMEEMILEALERVNQKGKYRETGFVPGVLYGDDMPKATGVKFHATELNKIISQHGAHVKVVLLHGGVKKIGMIKEVQRDPVTRVITYIAVQTISTDHEMKQQLPINFKGKEQLVEKQLQLQVYKADLEVICKMAVMPNGAEVDVSSMALGDAITIKNFNFDSQVKVTDKPDKIYAVVVHARSKIGIEPASIEAA